MHQYILLSIFCILQGVNLICCESKVPGEETTPRKLDIPNGLRHFCKEIKTREEVYYFRKLQKTKHDLRERNKYIYLEIPFYQLTWIVGWTMRGKDGSIRGRASQKKGLVTEYVIQYQKSDGSWDFIKNPKNSKSVFWNVGNIARPDIITKVTLRTPVRTLVLRLYPELWEGVPYVTMNINYCQSRGQLRTFNFDFSKHRANTTNASTTNTKYKYHSATNIKFGRKRPIIKPSYEKVTESNVKGQQIVTESNRSVGLKDQEKKKPKTNTLDIAEHKKKVNLHQKKFHKKTKARGRIIFNPSKLKCVEKLKWRYSNTNDPPGDNFTSRDNPSQAWRAMYGLNIIPYRFSLPDVYKTKRNNMFYIQISFHDPIKLKGLRIAGCAEENQVGIIKKFTLKFRLGGGPWTQYRDTKNKVQVFDIGNSTLKKVYDASTFRLPYPIKATDIRLYPEKWKEIPFISLDIKYCDLVDKKRVSNINRCIPRSLLKEKAVLVEFPEIFSKDSFYRNSKFKEINIRGGEGFKVIGINTKLPDHRSSAITAFVLKFMKEPGDWKSLKDEKGNIKVFSSREKYIKFPHPIRTNSMRLIPEKWTGGNPRLYVDFIGCRRE